jgi:hypothetical protein
LKPSGTSVPAVIVDRALSDSRNSGCLATGNHGTTADVAYRLR